tara:strand:- start:771 stop:1097 length:327 start_codon:yes stop_codon:yes gene_type:complete
MTKQISTRQRHRIASIAEKLGYDLNDVEFRNTGIRYKYWKKCNDLAYAIDDNVVPCVHETYEDSDCGELYSIRYLKHKDEDFASSSHNVRYRKVLWSGGYRLSSWKAK